MNAIADNRSQTSRFFLSALPAIGVTCGLFYIMQAAITVRNVTLEDPGFQPVLSIILPPEDMGFLPEEPTELKPIETVNPPPPRRIVATSPEGIAFEVAEYVQPDIGIPTGGMMNMIVGSPAIDREEAVPVRQPIPDYPAAALRKGLEGDCTVYFSIDAAGRPFNVDAQCSDQVFESSSERAVRKALFAARVKDGVAIGQDNLVYPIVYKLNGD